MLTAGIRPHRMFLAVAILAAVMLATLFAPAPGADAAKLTACVKKKTGAMKLVTGKKAKKKCPKGSRKVTWNKKGTTAPPIEVRDADGKRVGKLLGMFPASGAIYIVLRGGGQYIYFGSGEVIGTGNSPLYATPDCTGTAYLTSSFSISDFSRTLKFVGGPYRVVFRTESGGVLGPARAWKSSGTYQSVVALQTYEQNSTTGVCQPVGGLFSGNLISLIEVPAPPDFVGPLALK